MKMAIKYIYNENPLYVHLKKHFCPQCNTKVELKYKSKIVNSNSPEAKQYDFSLGDTFLVGDVEFRTRYFYCPQCKLDISFQQMKRYERLKKGKPIRGRFLD